MGGLIYILPISTNFNAEVGGYGFLALAVLIFGQWKPMKILVAAFFFGILKTISSGYSGIAFLNTLNLPNVVYQIFPYVATLILLVLTFKKSAGPAAAGEPFDKGKR